MAKKRVLVLFPTEWDRRQLRACEASWSRDYEVILGEPTDEDCPWDFDLVRYIERTVREKRGRIEGVFTSSDYPGAGVAAIVADRLGLPGPPPSGVLRASHKYKARIAQARSVPEATPPFVLIDPEYPASPFFPCFVKPIKGAFSIHTRRCDDARELEAFLNSDAVVEFRRTYVRMFNQLLREYSDITVDAGWFVAEGVLGGDQVTVEVFAHRGAHTLLGITDSTRFSGRSSFERFDYPSRMEPEIQIALSDTAVRAGRQLGLDDGLYNVELFFDRAASRIWVIEINPRLCGQFADLYQKVHGTNSYRIALDLATGTEPAFHPDRGPYEHATSFPLRTFEAVRVRRVPEPREIDVVESEFPGAQVWIECREGQVLSDFESGEDGESYRYAVVNLGAADFEDAARVRARIEARLGFDLEPLGDQRPENRST